MGQGKKSKSTLYLEIPLDKENKHIPEVRDLLRKDYYFIGSFTLLGDTKIESQIQIAAQNPVFEV